jgi:hypothetical protein
MLSGAAPPARASSAVGTSCHTHDAAQHSARMLRCLQLPARQLAVPLSLCRAAAASDGTASTPGRRRRRAVTEPREAGAPSSTYSTAPAEEVAAPQAAACSKSRGGTSSSKRHPRRQPSPTPPPAAVEFGPQPSVPGLERARAWVVFSDLHVSQASLGTALEVLQRVHQEARQRQAGVLFLGALLHWGLVRQTLGAADGVLQATADC